MKLTKKIISIVLCLTLMACLAACGGGTPDFKSGVQGTWALYHWYEQAEGGEDVFLDDTNFITVVVEEDSFTVTAADDSLEDVGGTYTWSKADEAEVIMKDGTRCTVQITANNKKHNESAVWDIFVVETNTTYCLEETKGTE